MCNSPELVANEILQFTNGHPYYTQQLAFLTWIRLQQGKYSGDTVTLAIGETIQIHDLDYERLWIAFNNTDKKIMTGLVSNTGLPLSSDFSLKHNLNATSTVYSSLKRLMKTGYIIKTGNGYEIDDPFF